jgi:hypothetical protein
MLDLRCVGKKDALTCPIRYKRRYSPETRGRIKRARYGLDKKEI